MLKDLPLAKVYQFIEPGPVVLLTTQAAKEKPDVMAMSWHMMLEFEPPLIACVVSADNHSFKALRKYRECVIAIPPAELAETVTGIGNCTGADTDKFGVYELTPLPAKHVAAPLIGEAIVNLECKVRDTRMVNAYNLFVVECVQAWQNPKLKDARTIHHHGYGDFAVDGEMIHIKSKMR
ncbi:flavin reductase family protein [Acidocella sp. KAb 2-4]|uniref:flavin reductase family protein n=1 Tax=Acidocella sp. KAb 2-4 TaxID=2885158 RepID=UPI001D08D25B|nr:flavin reductase family protein [Acidocella sp. KAb 2-4]MCB5943366.1 flavin reductase family protein [Acidocella sp. KAb 2-4]